MIDIQNLWIGDFIKLKKSGRKGRYEGLTKDGKVRAKVDDKIIITSLNNIELIDPPGPDPIVLFEEEENKNLSKTKALKIPKNEIDLHIDKLAPSMTNSIPSVILQYQIKSCQIFIDDAFEQKRHPIKIIHGKGEGVLKAEIHSILRSDHRIKFIAESNQGGATDAWFNL